MPGRDGTGPRGVGPVTGWGLGPCVNEETERGYGRGRRGGFGRRARYGMGYGNPRGGGRWSEMPTVSRKELLEDEIGFLKQQLDRAREELSQLKDTGKKEKE
jgi:hypothetical protein